MLLVLHLAYLLSRIVEVEFSNFANEAQESFVGPVSRAFFKQGLDYGEFARTVRVRKCRTIIMEAQTTFFAIFVCFLRLLV